MTFKKGKQIKRSIQLVRFVDENKAWTTLDISDALDVDKSTVRGWLKVFPECFPYFRELRNRKRIKSNNRITGNLPALFTTWSETEYKNAHKRKPGCKFYKECLDLSILEDDDDDSEFDCYRCPEYKKRQNYEL